MILLFNIKCKNVWLTNDCTVEVTPLHVHNQQTCRKKLFIVNTLISQTTYNYRTITIHQRWQQWKIRHINLQWMPPATTTMSH